MSPDVAEPPATAERPPRAFRRGVAAAGLPAVATEGAPVTEDDLAALPPPVRRYLHAMGVVGRPRTRSFRAHLSGRFRRGPDAPWMPCDAWQYNTVDGITRLFRMRLLVGRAVPLWGWDTYRAGHGRMRGKLLGLVPVANGSGPEFDTSELVTWLDDAVLMAPGMLLDPRVGWEETGADSFRVAVTDAGRTVGAEVRLGAHGRPYDVRTDDRWADLPGGLVRATWSTPVLDWGVVDGRPRLGRACAVWHLPDGRELPYGDMTVTDLEYDIAPGEAAR
ncbi:DUF6544 family protein [Blastococcus sp. URHD0036]|uniref:DUF6544 family protein n=1 Tax=Blastococcus sp. URHD0036 TaxID=1380356 RepID=UPI0004968525|nr:DUF6544 family protein [Blastococcus sp. URHD0036]